MKGLKQKKDRIFLFDFLRGCLLILIMIDHFFYDAYIPYGEVYNATWLNNLSVIAESYYNSLYRVLVRPIGLFILFFISGILTNFSKSNLKRTGKYGAIALLIFLVTFIFSKVTNSPNMVITIGVMYVFTVCSFIGWLIEKVKIPNFVILLLGLLFSVIGLIYYFGGTDYLTDKLFFLLYNLDVGIQYSADYFPLLPFMGYFLLGIYVSKVLYTEKKALIKFPKSFNKIFAPILFIGKTSLWWYVLSQGVFIAFFEILIIMGC
ncbi:MAG: DUF1624 domain-containing protein [Firmicutes bacterium]|nr:DUF1624 domain-containing protein [Candidatus Caballimonas caccae]